MRLGTVPFACIAAVAAFAAGSGSARAAEAPAAMPVNPPVATAPAAPQLHPAPPVAGAGSGPGELVASALSVYTPPACVPGVPFADITCTTGFDPWIEQFGLDGISAGCGGGNYCPSTPVTRDQMAVFIEKAMRGTGNWPPHTVLVYHHPAAEANSDVNSGSELLNLVGAIPSTGPEVPSSATRWLVKLGPGVWDFGSGGLSLPGWVSLEGSGLEETVLTNSSGVVPTVVTGGGVNTFTRLTMQNLGTGSYTYVLQGSGSRLVLDHAFAYAQGGTVYTIGVYADDSPIELYDGSGAYAIGGSSFGIYTHGSQYHTLTIQNSVVEGYTNAISNAAGYEVDMAYDGVFDSPLANYGAGVFKCIGNYDRNMSPVACP